MNGHEDGSNHARGLVTEEAVELSEQEKSNQSFKVACATRTLIQGPAQRTRLKRSWRLGAMEFSRGQPSPCLESSGLWQESYYGFPRTCD